jgi:hypothetical protein
VSHSSRLLAGNWGPQLGQSCSSKRADHSLQWKRNYSHVMVYCDNETTYSVWNYECPFRRRKFCNMAAGHVVLNIIHIAPTFRKLLVRGNVTAFRKTQWMRSSKFYSQTDNKNHIFEITPQRRNKSTVPLHCRYITLIMMPPTYIDYWHVGKYYIIKIVLIGPVSISFIKCEWSAWGRMRFKIWQCWVIHLTVFIHDVIKVNRWFVDQADWWPISTPVPDAE